MAKKRQSDTGLPLHRTLTPPGAFLVRMMLFVTLVGFLTAILYEQLLTALKSNPALNGLIIAVLVFGMLYAFRQVTRLYPEIRWINAFRIADRGLAISHQPILLAPMANMLRDKTGAISLSTASMRSIMDSISSRLDEARDTGRYMVGLLVFLGLLGTFWGLLETIQSVGGAINALDTKSNDNVALFDELKAGLSAPLKGMGTAFSASLLGLSGSLVLGFLELQASHAHNRFYNELEEWLSGITELTPGGLGASDATNRQIATAVYDLQRIVEDFSAKVGDRGALAGPGGANGSEESVRELARGVNQLVAQMRAEQKVVRQWIDDQASSQGEVASALKQLAGSMQRRGA